MIDDQTTDRIGIFAGDDPFKIYKSWCEEASKTEVNDPNAIALSTVDEDGLPNVRMVLLKEISQDAFYFYTNYTSQKAKELSSGRAAFVSHWKSLRRQVRVRGLVDQYDAMGADRYFMSRSVKSRLGAWASDQSAILKDRDTLEARLKEIEAKSDGDPKRPPFWGGYRLTPLEIEFWCDGENRLHDRFRWQREKVQSRWRITRLYP